MHLLVWLGLRPLFLNRPGARGWYGAAALLMILAPILIRMLDRFGMEQEARWLGWVGYSWMGFLFLLFCFFAASRVWNLLLLPLSLAGPRASEWMLNGVNTAVFGLALVLCAGGYSFYEATQLRIETVRISTDKLPPGIARLRIVQVSDMHLGLINRRAALTRVVDKIRPLNPDLLVATGDIVDGQLSHRDGLPGLLGSIEPRLGKFAVTGNHEYYAGMDQALRFLERSGFTLLRNSHYVSLPEIVLAGVDDPAGGVRADEERILKGADRSRVVLLLKHRPLVEEGSLGLFDLQLSGHSHKGQIFPFNFLTALRFPLQDGYYELEKGSRLYTSRGTGCWGPPMRLFSPPEITVIELERKP